MRSANPRSWPWLTLAVLALGLVFTVLPESLRTACEYDRHALANGEVWRLWTAHFVHFSARHAGIDLLTLSVIGICVEHRSGWFLLAGLLICAPPVLSLALYFGVPDLLVYRGASALCVACGVVLGLVLWHGAPAMRRWLLGVAGAFACKLVYEATLGTTNFSGLEDGVRVAWQAHVLGAAFGIFAFMAWRCRGPISIQENRDAATASRLLA